jgi:mannosidase alpha-like ER degradation enhancer 2
MSCFAPPQILQRHRRREIATKIEHDAELAKDDAAGANASVRHLHLFLCGLDTPLGLGKPPEERAQSASSAAVRHATPGNPQAAEQVRQEFLHAWNGNKQYARGHDELKPLSKRYHDWYGVSLLMTPVDALDTMVLMGLDDQAREARELIVTKLFFDRDIYVKNFEITIRLLGGLLSSYELTHEKRLLSLAEDLGDRLLPAFGSPTGMPYVEVNLRTGKVRGPAGDLAPIA